MFFVVLRRDATAIFISERQVEEKRSSDFGLQFGYAVNDEII